MIRSLAILVVALCLFTAGCNRHRVNFNVSIAYNAPVTIQEGLIISYPDDDLKEIYRIKLGKWWWTQNYEIPIAEAYLSELRGRFGPIFRQGITVTTNRTIDSLRAMEVESTESPTQERSTVIGTELDRLLDEIGAPRPEEPTAVEDTRPVQVRHREVFADAALEDLRRNQSVYLLRVNQAAYNFERSRCQVLLRVQLIDRRTGVILIDNNVYTGRSRTFTAFENEQTNNRELVDLTRQALAQAMHGLVRDVLEAVDPQ